MCADTYYGFFLKVLSSDISPQLRFWAILSQTYWVIIFYFASVQ